MATSKKSLFIYYFFFPFMLYKYIVLFYYWQNYFIWNDFLSFAPDSNYVIFPNMGKKNKQKKHSIRFDSIRFNSILLCSNGMASW